MVAGPGALSNTDFNNLRGVNLGAATQSTDATQFGQAQTLANTAQTNAQAYTDNQIAGLASGQTLKGTVRAYTATNVNTGTPGSTIDGLTPNAGDVFLLAGQSTGAQNGPWVWNGASTAMTRPSNWDTQAKAVLGSYWIIREGTSQDSFALLANDSFTFGTTTATFKLVGITQAAVVDGYSEQSPATAAGGSWAVTHNLATTKVTVQVWRVAAPGDLMEVAVRRPSASQITIHPDVALAAGEFEVMIKKVV